MAGIDYDPKKMEIENGSWNQWSKYVLLELQRLNTSVDKLTILHNDLVTKVSAIQSKICDLPSLEEDLRKMKASLEYQISPFLSNVEQNKREMKRNLTEIAIKVGIPTIGFLFCFFAWLYFTHIPTNHIPLKLDKPPIIEQYTPTNPNGDNNAK
jgi:hypothetical protein